MKIHVLDHGYVRLVEHVGNDLSIVRAARVSYDAEWRSGEDESKDEKLIYYLLKNKHTSPFEMVDFTFDCKMPIFVARQWARQKLAHDIQSFGRPQSIPNEFYIPNPEHIGQQSKSNKQARVMDGAVFSTMVTQQLGPLKQHCSDAYKFYNVLLASGWPRELARMVLPLNIYTHWFWKIDLHNLFHFLRLRLHEHAQYEIRVYAEAIFKLIEPIVPVAAAAFRSDRR